MEARRSTWAKSSPSRTSYFWGACAAYDAKRAASKLTKQGWDVTVSVSAQTVAFVAAHRPDRGGAA